MKVLATVMGAVITAALIGGYVQLQNTCSKQEMQCAIDHIVFPWNNEKPFVNQKLDELSANQKMIQAEVKEIQVSGAERHAKVMTQLDYISQKLGKGQ